MQPGMTNGIAVILVDYRAISMCRACVAWMIVTGIKFLGLLMVENHLWDQGKRSWSIMNFKVALLFGSAGIVQKR